MMNEGMNYPVSGWRRVCRRAASICSGIADAAGHVAAAILVLLTLSIIAGIVMRWIGVNNSWAYDLDLFTLAWVGYVGAAYTSLEGHHVTAGIALENMLGGRGITLSIIRVVIIVGFLILFCISGFHQTQASFLTNETTLDVFQWPVWMGKLSLPLGCALWAIAEIGKFLSQIGSAGEQNDSTAQSEADST